MNQYSLNYYVDIVLCIDCTESMDNILNIIKDRALSFHGDLLAQMHKKQKTIDSLRVRVVAFRDYAEYEKEYKKGYKNSLPMLETDFFILPNDSNKLEISVRSLHPIGGGDKPEDGLEALAYAIRSDWDKTPNTKHRHIIVLWTDEAPHPIGFASDSISYPKGMARDIRELTSWWGNEMCPGYIDQDAKRLVLFAPNEGEWSFISEQWDKTIHYPSVSGAGLSELDYETILSCISQSI